VAPIVPTHTPVGGDDLDRGRGIGNPISPSPAEKRRGCCLRERKLPATALHDRRDGALQGHSRILIPLEEGGSLPLEGLETLKERPDFLGVRVIGARNLCPQNGAAQ